MAASAEAERASVAVEVVVTQGQGARACGRWYLPDDRGSGRQRAFACTSLVLAARRGQAAEGPATTRA
jgi:hypothetical protein